MPCEAFEEDCDSVRGITATQEEVTNRLWTALKQRGEWAAMKLEVCGKHGSNCETHCTRSNVE